MPRPAAHRSTALVRVFFALVFAAVMSKPGASADVPDAMIQEVMIKTSLMTFNDANITGNYSVLHAKLSKPFREQFSAEKLKAAFRTFADQKIDFGIVSAKSPISDGKAVIDDKGILTLRGHFDTAPNHVKYELSFIPSEGEWKLLNIDVKIRPPGQ